MNYSSIQLPSFTQAYYLTIIGTGKFFEQPPPGFILLPIGTPLQLNCTLNEGFHVGWIVRIPGIRRLTDSDLDELKILNAHGIQVPLIEERKSQLTFSGAVEIRAVVWCLVTNNRGFSKGNRVEVIVYGKIVVITTITDSYVYQVLYHLPLT